MDEAFSALDPLIRSDMQDELLALEDRVQKTIIFVSHDLDEALKLGDRIALMKDGEVVQIGTPEEILTEPADSYVSKFVAGVDRSKILNAESVMKRPEPLISITSGPRVAIQLMKAHGISSIYVVEGKNRRLKGILMIRDALEALKTGKSLETVMIQEIPCVTPDLPLNEVIPLIADSQYPLAVVNDSGKLLGIIVRGSVLGALAMSGGNGQYEASAGVSSEEIDSKEIDSKEKISVKKPPEKTVFIGKNKGEAGPPSESSGVPRCIVNGGIDSGPVPAEPEVNKGAVDRSDAVSGPEVKTC